jgi:hypothetical protein
VFNQSKALQSKETKKKMRAGSCEIKKKRRRWESHELPRTRATLKLAAAPFYP